MLQLTGLPFRQCPGPSTAAFVNVKLAGVWGTAFAVPNPITSTASAISVVRAESAPSGRFALARICILTPLVSPLGSTAATAAWPAPSWSVVCDFIVLARLGRSRQDGTL